ncbi:MAG: Rpn family recombination-promoting nuclease/putative transposase [Selenomonadaceae bacterium]|nr:Rpn family recombination-promoting nuclease/putative transposase [Selenomonadaceae bacterium]
MKKLEPKYLEALKKFRLIDDAFFSACFDNNEADVQYILRIILEKSDLEVLKVQTQKSVENMYGRSVRFDVFATDKAGKLYNIEIQRSDSGAVPTRARYNSAMLDYHKLKKKAKFNELTETFVIFITEHDVLKDGEKIYHIDRIIRETGKLFEDGTHIVYVNGSYEGEEGNQLDDLIHDFFCENPADMRHRQLAERVEFLKDNKRGVRKL